VEYTTTWIPGIVLLWAVLLLLIVPSFALIALVIVALAAITVVAALLAAATLLLTRSLRRRLAEPRRPRRAPLPAGQMAQPRAGRQSAGPSPAGRLSGTA